MTKAHVRGSLYHNVVCSSILQRRYAAGKGIEKKSVHRIIPRYYENNDPSLFGVKHPAMVGVEKFHDRKD